MGQRAISRAPVPPSIAFLKALLLGRLLVLGERQQAPRRNLEVGAAVVAVHFLGKGPPCRFC